MERPIAAAVLIGAGLLAAGAAAAQAPPPGTACRADAFPLEQSAFGLSRVEAHRRGAGIPAYLARCPATTAACRQKDQVIPGEAVITGRPFGRFVCAYAPRPSGDVAGWIQSSRLDPAPVAASPPRSAWIGRWVKGDNTIDITPDGDRLAGVGHAWWPSAHPGPGQPGPDEARFSARSSPTGNRMVFKGGAQNDETLCLVTLVLVDRWLVVAGNGRCGAEHAAFTGVYRRP